MLSRDSFSDFIFLFAFSEKFRIVNGTYILESVFDQLAGRLNGLFATLQTNSLSSGNLIS
jgi:hypothetical protein